MYRKRKAIFKPVRTDDLREESKEFVGQEIEVNYGWTAEDHEQYPGQRIFIPRGIPLGWVPECDLEFTEVEDDQAHD